MAPLKSNAADGHFVIDSWRAIRRLVLRVFAREPTFCDQATTSRMHQTRCPVLQRASFNIDKAAEEQMGSRLLPHFRALCIV